MNKKPLKLKKFKSEDEERKFWEKVDLSKHFKKEDFAPVVFPSLKPSSRAISIRIPNHILARLKEQANQLNIPYQTLMKEYIAEGALRKQKSKHVTALKK